MNENTIENTEINTIVEMDTNTIENMETNTIVEMEENTPVNRKYPLNIDCLYELFEWLPFKECMNFAEAYDGLQCVADYTYRRRFTEFEYDFYYKDPIDRVFNHIGPFVRSLILILFGLNYSEERSKTIREACKPLQSLTLKGFRRRTNENNPFRGETYNSEVLTLNRCFLGSDCNFFENFTNLKSLSLIQCRGIFNMALEKCFKNNPMLTTFVCDGPYYYYFNILHLLPNLERICLQLDWKMPANLYSHFRNLRVLTLHCWKGNINDTLTELAKQNTLQRLEILDVRIDGNTFDIVNTLTNVERLVVTTNTREFTLTNNLPPKLKSLKLKGIGIFRQQITSLTKQLEHLEDILLQGCIIDNNGEEVSDDFDSMADVIVQAVSNDSQVNRKLNVILTPFLMHFPTIQKDDVVLGRLRISNCLTDVMSNVFQIHYPDIRQF